MAQSWLNLDSVNQKTKNNNLADDKIENSTFALLHCGGTSISTKKFYSTFGARNNFDYLL